jgi:hypothetical protein
LRKWLGLLIALLAWHGSTYGQYSGLSEAELRAPWEQHLVVLQSLSTLILGRSDAPQRAALANHLAALQVSLGEYETRVDEVIDRIIGDPQYAYVADKTSHDLSVQLDAVHGDFAALYAAIGVGSRADVQAAQASLATLAGVLRGKSTFERDLVSTLGSGSRQQIVDLATRWWKGEEQAIAVKKLAAGYREKVEQLQ